MKSKANRNLFFNVDKVEPKFKVGNWIVFNGWVLHINEIVNGYYITESIGGIPRSYDWTIDNIARLWTIQDAKDGDVLCCYHKADYPWIGIFHKLNAEGTFSSYCYLQAGLHGKFCSPNEENIFDNGKRNVDNHPLKDVVPATKEQRELLFQKIKEAGYTWDSENKEVKKIMQNLA